MIIVTPAIGTGAVRNFWCSRARWRGRVLRAAVGQLKKEERSGDAKSAGSKTAIARYLKETPDVINGWLAERHGMGSRFYVSKLTYALLAGLHAIRSEPR